MRIQNHKSRKKLKVKNIIKLLSILTFIMFIINLFSYTVKLNDYRKAIKKDFLQYATSNNISICEWSFYKYKKMINYTEDFEIILNSKI